MTTAYIVTVTRRDEELQRSTPCETEDDAIYQEQTYIRFFIKRGYVFDRRSPLDTVHLVRWKRTLNPLSWLFPQRERIRIRIQKAS